MNTKKQREIIRFTPGESVQLTLSSSPALAKPFNKETKWGTKTFFTLFTKDDRVFFATEALYNKLLGYNKGDSLVITLTEDKIWNVSPSGERQMSNIGGSILELRVEAIEKDIKEIKNYIYGGKEDEELKYPEENSESEEISF